MATCKGLAGLAGVGRAGSSFQHNLLVTGKTRDSRPAERRGSMAKDKEKRHVPPQPFTWWTSEIFRERALEDMSEEGRERYYKEVSQVREEERD